MARDPAEERLPLQSARRSDLRTCAAAACVFATGSLLCAVFSDGFLTADALTHYLYTKYAFSRPTYLVDVWGRPFVTALFALPAAVAGRLGVRVTSMLLALVCAALAYGIARGQGVRRQVLAFVFTLAQPLVFLHSFAEMTELPFAALAGAAFAAYQGRRWTLSAVLVALTPLARPEGFGLVALAGVAFLLQRRVLPLLLLPLPLVLWNHAGWEVYDRAGPWWRWLPDHWPYSKESTYPAGHPLQFVAQLPVVVSPFVLPAVLIGVGLSFSRDKLAPDNRHPRVCRVAAAFIPLFVLTVHSVLSATGKMASFGEPRYLLVAAPFWAVLAARGWEWVFDRCDWRQPVRWAVVAALLPAAALLYHRVLPLRTPAHWHAAEAFATEYRRQLQPNGYPRVLAAHPAVHYYCGIDPQDETLAADWRKEVIASVPAGTVLVWDPVYSTRNAHEDRVVTPQDVRKAGWVVDSEMAELLSRAARERGGRPSPDPTERLAPEGQQEWLVFRSPQSRL